MKTNDRHPPAQQSRQTRGTSNAPELRSGSIDQRWAASDSLHDRFCQTDTSARHYLQTMRRRRIEDLRLEYMPSPEFNEPHAEQEILGPLPKPAKSPRKKHCPEGMPAYIARLYDVPLLTAEQERHLFRKYNYLKFLAAKLRHRLNATSAADPRIDRIEQLYDQALATRNQIVRANLRLVVSIAKTYMVAPEQLFDLISEGNDALMRALEKFDYMRGFKFSTYATWAIKRNVGRACARESKYRDRFATGPDELFHDLPERRPNLHQQLRDQQKWEAQVQRILPELPDRERRIIEGRYGLAPGTEPKSLREVAADFGVSKERIRQLEARAMAILREAAQEAKLEAPEPV
jgi:RNA polymerase primary sigma factor